VIALIPAKKYSQRLEHKNLRKINKKPLIWYTIKEAKKSKYIDRIVVSTDCKKIKKISIKFGAEVLFKRPKKLCSQNSTLMDVCNHALNWLERNENQKKIRALIALQPTSPLRKSLDIDNCVKIFNKKKADLVTSFSISKPKNWHKELNKNNSFKNFLSKKNRVTQTAKKNYLLNGAVYVFSKKFLKTGKSKKNYAYLMPKSRSIDIDDIYDLEVAELFLKKNKRK
jgi:N-acylneuraminate cytidylyltransferase/CMP-N,N'-diacetyllegionaminic acid synthase